MPVNSIVQKKIILASTSKYRQVLLAQLNLEFGVVSPEINEEPLMGEQPIATCRRLALEKAQAVATRVSDKSALVIGADQVLDYDGAAVSKPGNHESALAQLVAAQGRTLTCYSALALVDAETGRSWSDVVPTVVRYRDLPVAELDRYLRREKPYDCAGAIKVEASGIGLLSRVSSDDPSALIGLPLIRLTDFLREAGHEFFTWGGS